MITLYAKELRPAAGEHENQLLLAGVLCKPPVVRRTPLGRDICDLMLAVSRRYGRADYLPVIAWDSWRSRRPGSRWGTRSAWKAGSRAGPTARSWRTAPPDLIPV